MREQGEVMDGVDVGIGPGEGYDECGKRVGAETMAG